MKRGLMIFLVVSLFVLVGCSSNEVCFSEEELEDMYADLEDGSSEESGIAYAPSQDSKREVFDRLSVIVSEDVATRDEDLSVEDCKEFLQLEGYFVSEEEEEGTYRTSESRDDDSDDDDYESAASS